MKEKSYWSDTVTSPPIAGESELPERVDVAIVGGGYTGLSAARELAKRGAKVAVLETQAFGWGASSRNGGMVLTGLKVGAGTLVKKYGVAKARELFCTSIDAINYAEQLIRDEQIDCDFARTGHLELAYKPAHFTAYAHEAELLQREFGHPVQVIEKGYLCDEIGSDKYHGGLVDEASAGLNPARYVAGLAQAVQRTGAHLLDQTEVTAIESSKSGHTITTSRGKLKAHEVIVATNGYTGKIVPWLQRRIIPIGSYLIATESLPADLAQDVSPRNRMMYDSKNFLYYFRLSGDSDRRMIFGGRAAFAPATPNTVRESAEILRRGMIGVYPQLRDVKVEFAWGGTLGFTFDLLPHAGVTRDGLHYALGCGGHGVALLTYLGACVAHQIAGEREMTDNPLFSLPFPTAPLGLYAGNPWFLPFAGMWYQFLDVVR